MLCATTESLLDHRGGLWCFWCDTPARGAPPRSASLCACAAVRLFVCVLMCSCFASACLFLQGKVCGSVYFVCAVYSSERCRHKYFSSTSGPGRASTIESCKKRVGCPVVRSCRLVPLLRRPQSYPPSAYPLILLPLIFIFHAPPSPPPPSACLYICLYLSLSLPLSLSVSLHLPNSIRRSRSACLSFPPPLSPPSRL